MNRTLLLFFILICSICHGDNSPSAEEQDTQAKFVDGFLSTDSRKIAMARGEYLNYLKKSENMSLYKASVLMKNGLPGYVNSSGDLIAGKSKNIIGSQIFDFIKSHNVVVMFSSSFSWGEHGRIDDGKFFHYPNSGFKTYKASTIWVSKEFQNIPVACALIVAHEYGHLLINETKFNYENGNYPEWFPIGSVAEEKFCNLLSGGLAEELNLHLYKGDFDQLSDNAKRFVVSEFGHGCFPILRGELWLNFRLSEWAEFSARGHRCGVRCKYFNRYKYCGNPVTIPPCHLYTKHLELLSGQKPSDPSE